MPGKMSVSIAFILLPTLAAASACSSEKAATAKPTKTANSVSSLTKIDLPAELSQEATDMALIPRPLTSVVRGAKDDELALSGAIERGIQQCMKSKGFDYERVPPSDGTDFTDNRTFGDVEYAETHGQVGYRPDPNAPSPEERTRQNQPSEAYHKALGGDPFGPTSILITDKRGATRYDSASCLSIGTERVVGDHRKYRISFRAVENLANDLNKMVVNSAQWGELQSRWSACMTTKGYTFENRLAAYKKHSEISVNPREGQPSDEQRKLAVAVTTCERKVNAAGHYKALVKHAEDTAGPEAESIINTYRELRTTAFARAKELNNTN